MRSILFIVGFFTLLAVYSLQALSAEPVFYVTAETPVIQDMVPSSTQQLSYTINVPSPPQSGPAIIIKCSLTFDNSVISAPGFNPTTNGCINGVGFSGKSKTALVNIPLIAGAAAGTANMTLTFTMDNSGGTHKIPSPPVVIKTPITVPVTANRTMTFYNYCKFPVYFALASGKGPALNVQNINTACTKDSDCSGIQLFSRCVSGYCGGGVCKNNNNAGPASSSTDCAVHTDPNAGPPPKDPSPCTNNICSFCNTSSDCITGTYCNSNNHQCYWQTPSPADSSTKHYQLAAYTGQVPAPNDQVSFTSNSSTNGYSLLWSGGIGGRTGCGGAGMSPVAPFTGSNSCLTGGCNLGTAPSGSVDDSQNGGCYLGQGLGSSSTASGGANPVTLSEFTLVSLTPDTYDVTIINGTNIPVTMYPVTDGAGAAIASPAKYGNPYSCGSPGSNKATTMNPVSASTTVGSCSWNFENSFLNTLNPVNLGYRWVANDNATVCASDTTCAPLTPSGHPTYKCGLTSNAVGASPSSGSAQTTCGTLLGYWTQDEICAANSTYNPTGNPQTEIVDCTTASLGGNTLIELLNCSGLADVSCFTKGASATSCCGCTSWSQLSGVPTSTSVIKQCTVPNTAYWVADVLPGLNFLKDACLSAYVYPFDDPSSTFTCPQNAGQSGVNYNVEFCPGGESGGIG